MAVRDEVKRLFPAAMFWRLALIALLLACVLISLALWKSGEAETRQAKENGRRLIAHLNDGSIEGKMPAPAAAADAPPPAADTPATAPAASSDTMLPVVPAADMPPSANPALISNTPDGPLPIVGKDGTKPWRAYAKAAQRNGKTPVIAIVITGLGQSKVASNAAIRLPDDMTLSFSPYAHDLNTWITAAHTAGHELMLDLPLEPSNYPTVDPGPDGLLIGKGADGNEKSLRHLMGRTAGYTGFVLPQNEVISQHDDLFKPLLQSLGGRGLMVLVSHEPAREETKQVIDSSVVVHVTSDEWLDEELDPQAIQARLAALEQTALDRGYAVGMAQAYPITMQQLAKWAETLAGKGIVLMPLSAIARQKFS